MQTSVYQANRQQLLMMGSTIFVSVTAAVIVSTLLIMSLMRGEIANALTSNVQNSTPTSQVTSTCAVPTSEQDTSTPTDQATPSVMSEEDTASEPLMTTSFHPMHAPAAPSINDSFNSTNISNVTTTNNITNTELHKTTVIKDSFNKDSYNDNSKDSNNTVVVKDNEVTIDSNNTKNVNSNNTVDIDKKTTNNVTNNVTTTDNSHSNNVIVKDNDVDILSDNKVVVPVLPVAPLPIPAV